MTDDRDPSLQALFANADRRLDDADFAATVMTRIDAMRRRRFYVGVAIGLVVLGFVALIGPLLMTLAGVTAQGISTAVVDIEEGILAQILSPVNNVATALVLVVAVLFGVYRKVFR